MKRLFAALALCSLLAPISRAAPVGVPKLDVEKSCREAQAFGFGGGQDDKLAYKGCMQDENDALAQLKKNWSRYKPENRANCVAQGISPMPSYVEILTCIEMYDDASQLNRPGSSVRPFNGKVPADAPPAMTPPAPANPIDSK
ncbi:conserved exported hypothetical protein [Methylocella tundrae]|jgi:hypothetical protein|uniref:Uncharacterized protein n=1 Tax=Methylocella tundrae TaxID=227605 RepID=A0A4V6IM84_METTU|nr:hypothetical protein [Methylocella tundrae]WPP05105.1 hypothetical protein SIN04_04565 [Methylocella tundrae]VFU07421.1 conserved exported protein of unknown function [Methylocella tundrae]VTZ27168.1 conserved exported hypothetical protein [Methylocella tundrae]VTZ49165.1 conserved exported hypothetical protein [Methylocella tundrae]